MSGTVDTAAVVGVGALGSSWVALLLAHGARVVAADPDATAGERLRSTVERQLRDLDADVPDVDDRSTFTTDAASAVREADLVIEAGPERLDLKRELVALLDENAPPGVLIASSSSGLAPSSFQDAARRDPGRVLVVHPFNPPHLVPLVEVVGGSLTTEASVARAIEVFSALGKKPIRLNREVPGHVANRLQAALWREAYHLIATGVVSAADLDTAIASGPGLRWALLGPMATQHLSGGPGGMRHVLDHLGPPMVDWWHDLGAPELTDELTDAVVRGVDDELDGVDQNRLLARRDRALRELLQLKHRHDLG